MGMARMGELPVFVLTFLQRSMEDRKSHGMDYGDSFGQLVWVMRSIYMRAWTVYHMIKSLFFKHLARPASPAASEKFSADSESALVRKK